MAPADGLDALEARRAKASATKRRLPPPRHPKAEQEPATAATPKAEPEAAPVPAPKAPRAAPLKAVKAPQSAAEVEVAAEQAPRRRSRVRATQVHLDEAADDHLSELRKRAVMADVDLTASAVLRLALAELVERHGYDAIVTMFAHNDGGRLRRGRPRS